jgi:hypothetical protein
MSMAFRLFAPDLMLVVHGDKPPSDAQWNAFVDCMHARAVETKRVPHTLVLSTGGSPNARQRAISKERVSDLGDATERIAVLTSSAIVRGAVTALAWIVRNNFRAFAPSEMRAALLYLGVDHPSDAIRSELHTLAKSCGAEPLDAVL